MSGRFRHRLWLLSWLFAYDSAVGVMVSLRFGFSSSSRASVQAVSKFSPRFITRFCSSLFSELVGKFDLL